MIILTVTSCTAATLRLDGANGTMIYVVRADWTKLRHVGFGPGVNIWSALDAEPWFRAWERYGQLAPPGASARVSVRYLR
jgi:hypothetical protein